MPSSNHIALLPSPPASPIPHYVHTHPIPPQQQQQQPRRKRSAYSSNRVIPSLRRHETMLFGDPHKPVACQSQDNYTSFQGMVDESSDEERRRGSQSSSTGTSQESVAIVEA